MFTRSEQIAAVGKANIKAFTNITGVAFATAEKLFALNLDTVRSLVEDGLTGSRQLIEAHDAQEALDLQASLGKPILEKIVAYNCSTYQLLSQQQAEAAKLFETHREEASSSLNRLIDKTVESAPPGTGAAFTAVKTAIAAANNACDSIDKAARQSIEAAEATLRAAVDATVKNTATAGASRSKTKKMT